MRFSNVVLIALAIGYSFANPTPRKCNRKHILEARVDEPVYYVFDPNQDQYPYVDPSVYPASPSVDLAGAEIRTTKSSLIHFHLVFRNTFKLFNYIIFRSQSSTIADGAHNNINLWHRFHSLVWYTPVLYVTFPSIRYQVYD